MSPVCTYEPANPSLPLSLGQGSRENTLRVEPPKERGQAGRECCGESKRRCRSGLIEQLAKERTPAAYPENGHSLGLYHPGTGQARSSHLLRKHKQPLAGRTGTV